MAALKDVFGWGLELQEFYAEPPRTSRSVGGKATDTIPDREVNHDRPARAECPCGVRRVRGHDCRAARTCDVFHAIDRDGQLPLDDVPHLLFRMAVLVYRNGVSIDLVVHEGHVVGVEETTVPTRKRLPGMQLARVDESHDVRISAAEACLAGQRRLRGPGDRSP